MFTNYVVKLFSCLSCLILNLQIPNLESLPFTIRIIIMIMVILYPLPHILQPRNFLSLLIELIFRYQSQSLQQRRRCRCNINLISWPDEVENAKSMDVVLIGRRASYSMSCGF